MDAPQQQALEPLIREVGSRLYRGAIQSRPALFGARGVRGALLRRALADEELRTALFQFIDVLPQLDRAGAIADHFKAYLDGHPLAGMWGRLLRLGSHPALAWAVRASVARTARLFLVEESPSAVKSVLAELARSGAAATLDAVGEAVLTEREADAYVARYHNLLAWQQAAGLAPHVSLKLTALNPRFDSLDAEGGEQRVLARLAPLMAEVACARAALTVDMEQYELKPLILRLFRALVETHADRGWLPGIALQAYLPETERDLAELARWARAAGRRISVRLVKGAYWDTEVAAARQRRWPVPVFLDKAETDARYERLTQLLFEQRDAIYPAIAGHNLRSLSHAVALAQRLGMAREEWEIQMLYGMAEPLARAVSAQGVRLRVYVPTGDLVIGIAYLIRRLLENTASTSILRQTYADGGDLERLLAAPAPGSSGAAEAPAPAFANTPLTDFSRDPAPERFARELKEARSQLGRGYPLAIRGTSEPPAGEQLALNPARPSEVLGRVALAGRPHAEQAVANALRAFPAWRATPAARRVELALRAAGIMLERRAELAAWQVLEQAKNWREADADVAEAIDYLRYYAAETAKLDGWRPTLTYPGETNLMRYEPRGVAAIIAPWNFPLAILAGMTSAALVTGNCAIMKPAAPALIVGHKFHEILLKAGFPPETCQLVPGRGVDVGDFLVRHPQVNVIAFTGSREVGLAILEQAGRLAPGQTHVKRVVCEMGGKNAIIVDEDADLDEAVVHVLHSAFGYQGQKCSACSRLIAVGPVHDRLVARLAEALACYPYGPPEDPRYVLGPVITRQAQEKALGYIEIGRREGRLYHQGKVPAEGYYVPPALFTGIEPHHRLAREEMFAPILSVLQAASFEQALEIALDSDYALTGGVFSRLPGHLALARERFRVGNLYLNRRITGALVAAQPFGGVRLSGTGVQAGGADYLKQFMWSRVISENTMRHGFVPSPGPE
ncbi:MAG: bifunctional proline dehydrogenase/L-glutamate gamma-semialdehyde dehydrogenase [Betaproteobacteria bacterium]|nr:bifunctional proline dehydrogenase/L-glutamate gamma-semialdehyde dehydrogenase [Betaproteobacteria bacterium]